MSVFFPWIPSESEVSSSSSFQENHKLHNFVRLAIPRHFGEVGASSYKVIKQYCTSISRRVAMVIAGFWLMNIAHHPTKQERASGKRFSPIYFVRRCWLNREGIKFHHRCSLLRGGANICARHHHHHRHHRGSSVVVQLNPSVNCANTIHFDAGRLCRRIARWIVIWVLFMTPSVN